MGHETGAEFCDNCRKPLLKAQHFPAVGADHGARLYKCEDCGRVNWRDELPKQDDPKN